MEILFIVLFSFLIGGEVENEINKPDVPKVNVEKNLDSSHNLK